MSVQQSLKWCCTSYCSKFWVCVRFKFFVRLLQRRYNTNFILRRDRKKRVGVIVTNFEKRRLKQLRRSQHFQDCLLTCECAHAFSNCFCYFLLLCFSIALHLVVDIHIYIYILSLFDIKNSLSHNFGSLKMDVSCACDIEINMKISNRQQRMFKTKAITWSTAKTNCQRAVVF